MLRNNSWIYGAISAIATRISERIPREIKKNPKRGANNTSEGITTTFFVKFDERFFEKSLGKLLDF